MGSHSYSALGDVILQQLCAPSEVHQLLFHPLCSVLIHVHSHTLTTHTHTLSENFLKKEIEKTSEMVFIVDYDKREVCEEVGEGVLLPNSIP